MELSFEYEIKDTKGPIRVTFHQLHSANHIVEYKLRHYDFHPFNSSLVVYFCNYGINILKLVTSRLIVNASA